MRSPLPWRPPSENAAEDEKRTADGIYGLIVGASVMAAGHFPSSGRLAVAVLATLLVYWAAERYATVMAGHIAAGRRRPAAEMRRDLAHGWEIVTTSFIPLLVLVAVDLLGGDVPAATLAALLCTTLLLFLAGLRIGRDGGLGAGERLLSGAGAGAFGLVLIALEVALH